MIRKSPDIYPFDLVQLVALQDWRRTLQSAIDSGDIDIKHEERAKQEIEEVGAAIYESRYSVPFRRTHQTVA